MNPFFFPALCPKEEALTAGGGCSLNAATGLSPEIMKSPLRIWRTRETVRAEAFPIPVPVSIPVSLPIVPVGHRSISKIAATSEVVSATITVSSPGAEIEGTVPEAVSESVVVPGPVGRLPVSSPIVVIVRNRRAHCRDKDKEHPTEPFAKCSHKSSTFP
jgi:hypothetical protein